MMSRQVFGNIFLASGCLITFCGALHFFRVELGRNATRFSVIFWSLVAAAMVANLFYLSIALLRRWALRRQG